MASGDAKTIESRRLARFLVDEAPRVPYVGRRSLHFEEEARKRMIARIEAFDFAFDKKP